MQNVLHRLLAVLLLASVAACGSGPEVRGYQLDIPRCGTASVIQTTEPVSRVVEVTVGSCPGVTDPVDHVGRRVWLGLAADVDSIIIRPAGRASAPVVLSRSDLQNRYGSRPRRDQGPSTLLWLLLLGCPIAFATGVIALLRGGRPGLVVIFARAR